MCRRSVRPALAIVGILVLAGLLVQAPAASADVLEEPVVSDNVDASVNGFGSEATSEDASAVPVEVFEHDLGTLGGLSSFARGVNDRGQVVGESRTCAGNIHAFLWQADVMTDLGTLGSTYSVANAINDLGEIVGTSGTVPGEAHAFLWRAGVMMDLGTLGGSWSFGNGINHLGQVVGVSETPGGDAHAFLWQDGVMSDLGALGGSYSVAKRINDLGQIVGTSGDHAALWQDGTLTDLGTLGGSYSRASDINNLGQVVGTSASPVGESAFLWQDGVMTNLGTLGGSQSAANGIDELGQVVGFSGTTAGMGHAFLWWEGEMTDLGTLGGMESVAEDVNNFGQVVGVGDTTFGETHAILWDVPDAAAPPLTTLLEVVNGDGIPIVDGGSTVSNVVTFTFASTPPDTAGGFTCALDGVSSACSSPVGYTSLVPGAHRFEVYASDALGRHGDPVPSFGWIILTPAEAVRVLAQKVRSLGLASGTSSSLLDPLHVADNLLSNDRPSDDGKACRQLDAFIDLVSLYNVKARIPSEQAQSLTMDATEIMTALGCP